jgi:NgoMIV restriction enzyme
VKAVAEAGGEDAMDLLKIMVDGKRMKDISDLPLDLAL